MGCETLLLRTPLLAIRNCYSVSIFPDGKPGNGVGQTRYGMEFDTGTHKYTLTSIGKC